MKTLITSLLIAVTLSACGWHLRGSTPDASLSVNDRTTPMSLHISSIDNHSTLVANLRQQFHAFNTTETDSVDANTLHLTLNELKIDKRAAGVGADALVNVYELTLTVNYQVERNGELLTNPSTRATITRTYNFEVNQVNYSEQEEAIVLREMHREIAQQILRRLKVLNNQ